MPTKKKSQPAPRLQVCPQAYRDLMAGKPCPAHRVTRRLSAQKKEMDTLSRLLRLLQDKVGQQS